uniref:Cystathionine beta-synthase n=1 Tax=Rhabditophanes sp. KR3021 TaxID=114890 RepID=A0AC35TIM3_9BILA
MTLTINTKNCNVWSSNDQITNIKNNGKILDNVLDAVGNTPLVRLNKIQIDFGVKCNIYVKPEFLNSGGSLRDRIAVKLIEHAEKNGILKKDMTIIEVFDNLAMPLAALVKQYKLIVIMPEDVPVEVEVIAKALGTQVVRTNSHLNNFASKLQKELIGGIILDESIEAIDEVICEETIEKEILNSLKDKVDMLVLDDSPFSKGIANKMQIEIPDIEIIHISNNKTSKHVIVSEKDACNMARRLTKEEGLLCGKVSGQNVFGALICGKKLRKDQNMVIILPDSLCDYMTHFVDDEWMVKKEFIEQPVYKQIIPSPEHPFKEDIKYHPSYEPSESWKYPKEKDIPNPLKSILVDNILGAIGHTPLVRLNKIPQSMGIEAEILVKLEYLNPGGSTKDRPALRMVESAEEEGLLKHTTTIIESTAGNTGLGLALVGCVKNYKTLIVMLEKMSKEKEVVLRALGADTVRTPNSAPFDSCDSHFGVAIRLNWEMKDSVILDQYTNKANPQAHYLTTGEEILHACDGKVDMVVAGVGTTGTICGIGKRVKEVIKDCKIIAVDPYGSKISDLSDETNKRYELEGIGNGFRASVIQPEIIDRFFRVEDKPSFEMALRLIREEGILCGGTAGANVYAALEEAKKLKKGDRVVVILPDGVRNYLTKFVSQDWMKERDYAYPK